MGTTACSTLAANLAKASGPKAEGTSQTKGAAEAEPAKEEVEEPVVEAPDPEPNPALRESVLQCIPGLAPKDLMLGRVGKYKFTEGINTSERTGFLDRQPIEMTNDCFIGELQPEQCVAFTFDEKKYAELGNSNEWEMQCIYSDDPQAGAVKNPNERPSQDAEDMSPYYFMLMCNHDQDSSYACHEGSNSMRGIKHREELEKKGKQQMGFCINKKMYQEVTYDVTQYPKGRYMYCQYYNKKTNKSAFGFEYLLLTNQR